MKHVQACLCASKDLERNFNHFGCPAAGPTLFKYQERSRKQFSSLCSTCNTRGSLFMCVKYRTERFYPPEMSCEVLGKISSAVFTTVEVE